MILATDILVKTMFEAGLNDLRKNTWLLDDVFSGLADDSVSKLEYGWKEVKSAKEWFINQNIPVYLGFRVDQPTMPCITVVQQSISEDLSRASLADEGMLGEIDPSMINRPIQKVIRNFTPKTYDPSTKILILPDDMSTDTVAEGMYVVAKSGKCYIIKRVLSGQSFELADKVTVSLTDCFISPASSLWNVHRELTYLSESYAIGIHTQSEPHVNIWLRQITIYMLLRYKEVLLENRGFALSTFSVQPMSPNSNFGADRVFSTFINLSGTVQADWIKFVAPKLDKVSGGIRIDKVGPKDMSKLMTPDQYKAQVKTQSWQMLDDQFNATFDDDSEGFESGGLM